MNLFLECMQRDADLIYKILSMFFSSYIVLMTDRKYVRMGADAYGITKHT
jgi:hypothetical protein